MAILAETELPVNVVEDGAEEVRKYITETQNGIRIHPDGNDQDYINIDADSFDIYMGNKKVATFSYTYSGPFSGATLTSPDWLYLNSPTGIVMNNQPFFDEVPSGGHLEPSSITTGSSKVEILEVHRCFNVVTVHLSISGSISSGSSLSGTIEITDYAGNKSKPHWLPLNTVTGVAGYGSNNLRVLLRNDGTYSITNVGSGSITSSQTCRCSLTYVTEPVGFY